MNDQFKKTELSLDLEKEVKSFGLFLSSHSLEKSTYTFYMSDIRHFLNWKAQESDFSKPISPNDVITYLEAFSNKNISPKSLNRKLSSLRRYDQYLQTKGSQSFMYGIANKQAVEDDNHPKLKKFLEYIKLTKSNDKTVKNYTSDIKQFSTWLSESDIRTEITSYEVNKYLLEASGRKSASSVKRAKSCLYQFLYWQNSLNKKQSFIYKEETPKKSEKNHFSPYILLITGAILLSPAYLPARKTTMPPAMTNSDITAPNLKESPEFTNTNLSFIPNNTKTKIVLTDNLDTQVEQDITPFVVETVDYSSLYSDPDISITNVVTSGRGTIAPYHNKAEVFNSLVRKSSVVQITPTSSTKNNVIYIAKQGDGYFSVAIDESISEPINFVWTIN